MLELRFLFLVLILVPSNPTPYSSTQTSATFTRIYTIILFRGVWFRGPPSASHIRILTVYAIGEYIRTQPLFVDETENEIASRNELRTGEVRRLTIELYFLARGEG